MGPWFYLKVKQKQFPRTGACGKGEIISIYIGLSFFRVLKKTPISSIDYRCEDRKKVGVTPIFSFLFFLFFFFFLF
jgi:hypothetical protein